MNNNLNAYLANLAVLNIKIHNLHWNVVGREFKAVHKMTEKIYKELQCQFDEVAEAMKMQGELPMASMAEYLEAATIEELESRDYSVGEVLDLLDEDCDTIINQAMDIRHEADEEDNFMIANMFEDYLAKFYKKSWMIKSMLVEEEIIELEDWDEEDADPEMKGADDMPPKPKKGPKEKPEPKGGKGPKGKKGK